MSKKSNRLPKNTTIRIYGIHTEIFWQTANCDHFMDNYRTDTAKTAKSRFHNLRFNQVAQMLSGNVYVSRVPKSDNPNKYYALSYYQQHYYFTTFTLESRTDTARTLFAIIITSYITYEDRHIDQCQAYLDDLEKQFGW